jgi:hypothetical protein
MYPITRQDLELVNFVFAKVGREVTTSTHRFRLVDYNRRVWDAQLTSVPAKGKGATLLHSRIKNTQVIVDQYVKSDSSGVAVRLNITGFRLSDPRGVYVEVSGKIGDQWIRASASWSPEYVQCDEIEVLIVDQYACFLTLTLNEFTLAVLEVIGEEIPPRCS